MNYCNAIFRVINTSDRAQDWYEVLFQVRARSENFFSHACIDIPYDLSLTWNETPRLIGVQYNRLILRRSVLQIFVRQSWPKTDAMSYIELGMPRLDLIWSITKICISGSSCRNVNSNLSHLFGLLFIIGNTRLKFMASSRSHLYS